jgi:cytochrome c553
MMLRFHGVFALASIALVPALVIEAQVRNARPAWAYAIAPAGGAPPPPQDDAQLVRIPGNGLAFTVPQLRDPFGPADWFPSSHPRMPDVVARGRRVAATPRTNGGRFEAAGEVAARGAVVACALCHYPNGQGRPENAGVSGLPEEYFVQQLRDFKNGMRKSAEPRKANTNVMASIAKALTEEEMRAAAAYYASIPFTPWVEVMESDTVPKTHIDGGIFFTRKGHGTEPIGSRIIETPVDGALTDAKDPRSGFVAYVPVGSVSKGAKVVAGKTASAPACEGCHGAGLKGAGSIPPLAGRSPSYVARQLYDIQQSSRRGAMTGMMKRVVAQLTEEDIVNIAAYTASLEP